MSRQAMARVILEEVWCYPKFVLLAAFWSLVAMLVLLYPAMTLVSGMRGPEGSALAFLAGLQLLAVGIVPMVVAGAPVWLAVRLVAHAFGSGMRAGAAIASVPTLWAGLLGVHVAFAHLWQDGSWFAPALLEQYFLFLETGTGWWIGGFAVLGSPAVALHVYRDFDGHWHR